MKNISFGMTLVIAAISLYIAAVAVFNGAGASPVGMTAEQKVMVAGLLGGSLWFAGAGVGYLRKARRE